ncbi:podocalyxin [Protopterus annectens]|uniref:podocalyxin n=1 Tax=Protopterus annectens TaxID=7888 RepID=UPI001CF9FA8D|nr:podocalyxin [Protopterus annectens]
MDNSIKLVCFLCFLGLILSVPGIATSANTSTEATTMPSSSQSVTTVASTALSSPDPTTVTSAEQITAGSSSSPPLTSSATAATQTVATQTGDSSSITTGSVASSTTPATEKSTSEEKNSASSATTSSAKADSTTEALSQTTEALSQTSVTAVNSPSSLKNIAETSTAPALSSSSAKSVTEQTVTSSSVPETAQTSTKPEQTTANKSELMVSSTAGTSSLSSSALPPSTLTETSSSTGMTTGLNKDSTASTTPSRNETRTSVSAANYLLPSSSTVTSSSGVTTITNSLLPTSVLSQQSSTSTPGKSDSDTREISPKMKCTATNTSGLNIALNLTTTETCDEYIKSEGGKKLADMLCSLKKNNSEGHCIMTFNVVNASGNLLHIHSILYQVDYSKDDVIQMLKDNHDKLKEFNISGHKGYMKSDDNQGIDKLTLWLALAVLCCLAVLCLLFGLSVFICNQRKLRTKDQQRLTEELHTVENGYHDNPTLEVTDTQPEMHENKINLNGELGDAWIVPLDNLSKEELEEEEDTHL